MNTERLERLPRILAEYPNLKVDLVGGTIKGKAFTIDKEGRREAGMWLDNEKYGYFRYEIIAYLGGINVLNKSVIHKNGIVWDDRIDNLEAIFIDEN